SGTGRDFVRTFAIPASFDEAVRVALEGRPRSIDLGLATYSGGSSYFANVASAGMSGAIAKRTNETTKRLGGKLSYLWATLAVFAGWKAVQTRVSVDGETREAALHDVIVANGRYFGGGMMMCPEADPGDGLFDV